jgi:hypothetical protein
VAFSTRLPGKPGQMFLSKGTLWVAIQGRPGRLLALDPNSGRVRRSLRLPVSPLRFVMGFGSLWLSGQGGGARYGGILRLDPSSGRVQHVIHGTHGLGWALAATRHAVWVAGPDTFPKGHPEKSGVYFVYKIDPRRGAVVRRVRLRSTVIDLAGDGAAVWVTGWIAVVKLADSGRTLFRQPIGGGSWSVARASDGAWVALTFHGSRNDKQPPPARELLRIREHSTPHLTRVPLADSPWLVSAAGGVSWTAAGSLEDPDSRHQVLSLADTQPLGTPTAVPVSGIVRAVQAAPRGAWVAQQKPNRLSRIC